MEARKIIAIAMMACFGIAVWRMNAMREQTGVVIFKPISGEPIRVPLNKARLFGTIDNMLMDSTQEREEVPVPMSATTLREVLNDLQWVLDVPGAFRMAWESMTPEQVRALGVGVRARRAEKVARAMVARTYTLLDLKTLIESYKAAVYLDSPELIEKYAREIAKMVTSDEALKVLAKNNPELIALISDSSINQDVKRVIFRYMPQPWIEFTSRIQEVYVPISEVAISADGNTVVTGFDDGTVKIEQWNRSQWEEVYTNENEKGRGLRGAVTSVAISKVGKTVVTGSSVGMVKIVQSGWREQYSISYRSLINSVAISADGNTVVTGSADGTARIMKLNGSWTEQYTIPHEKMINSVAISGDGKTVVTGSEDGAAKIVEWDGHGLQWVERYSIRHKYSIESVAISGDGKTVVTGSENGTAKIMKRDGSQWKEQYTISHEKMINSVAISGDGKTVVTGSEDGAAKIVEWDGHGLQWVERYSIRHKYSIESVAISGDGKTVVTGSENGTARIVQRKVSEWDEPHTIEDLELRKVSEWEECYTISHEKMINSVAISGDGKTVVTGYARRHIARLSPADTFDRVLLLRLCAWNKKHDEVQAWHTGWVKSVMDTFDEADQERIKREFAGTKRSTNIASTQRSISNNNNQ